MPALVNEISPYATTQLADPNPLTLYSVTTTYQWDFGLLPVPPAAPVGAPVGIVRTQAPVCYKIVAWCAERIGDLPPVPLPDTGTDNEILAAKAITGAMAGQLLDGSPVLTLLGTYWYLLLVAPSGSDPLYFGTAPYNPSGTATVNMLTVANYSPCLGPVPPISGYQAGQVPGKVR